jgi:predicted alpha-1,2-mannosidase
MMYLRNAFLLFSLVTLANCSSIEHSSPLQYVDPFIGTGGHGHTFPGATVPFGMVQLSPQTRVEGWDGTSGYHFTDDTIYGFAHTALSGTGVSDYGDILITPLRYVPERSEGLLGSFFDKAKEKASPNFYSVYLEDSKVSASLTASHRAGIHQYRFVGEEERYVLIDLQYRDLLLDSKIEYLEEEKAFVGYRRSSNWANDMHWFFYMSFDCEVDSIGILEKDSKMWVKFPNDKELVTLKIALSPVDQEGAKNNFFHEINPLTFEECLVQGQVLWSNKLNKIQVEGGSQEQKTIFYTALYHCYLHPNIYQDVDGRYRGMDQNIHHTDGDYYTVFSLWDTYRALHPLMTIIDSAATVGFVNTFLDMYDKTGQLPVWELAANETGTMIGNHAISVLADVIVKGYPIQDKAKVLSAIVQSVNRNDLGYREFRKYGYIPGDMEHESISKTLEYAYNDWCIAQIAKQWDEEALYQQYIVSAQNYKNIFDASSGFMRPKINGSWMRPFDPTVVDWHYTEANAWQYNFYVPQDVKGLTQLFGGRKEIKNKIDSLFTLQAPIGGRDMKDITGLIGQYAHGNEPSHHMAYFYNFLGHPEDTQERVWEIMNQLYSVHPEGLSGNEDCGQMSAWLVMSAMGFYSFTPGADYYTIGAPWFKKITLQLENGKQFIIDNKNFSSKAIYVQKSYLNGIEDNRSFLNHKDIVSGGEISFLRSKNVPTAFGKDSLHMPNSSIEGALLSINPTFGYAGEIFSDSVLVSLEAFDDSYTLYYSLGEELDKDNLVLYQGPFFLHQSNTVQGMAYHPEWKWSSSVSKVFSKLPHSIELQLDAIPSPNYTAGGPIALVDGMRGTKNWRVGRWMGFQGNDLEVSLDLGEGNSISQLGGSFLQDIKSWIWFPEEIQVLGSSNGVDYRVLGTVKPEEAVDDYTISTKEWIFPLNGSFRYVKLRAKQLGIIPEWHLGAGFPSYIFIDEILFQ